MRDKRSPPPARVTAGAGDMEDMRQGYNEALRAVGSLLDKFKAL